MNNIVQVRYTEHGHKVRIATGHLVQTDRYGGHTLTLTEPLEYEFHGVMYRANPGDTYYIVGELL